MEDLETVTMSDSVTNIGKYTFINSKKLKNVRLSNNITTIEEQAFRYCEALETINIPKSLQKIEIASFYNCINLQGDLLLPEGLHTIGSLAFENCRSITSVTIPKSLTSMGSYAFTDCVSLNAVYLSDLSAWCNLDFPNYSGNPITNAKNLYLNNQLIEDLVIPDDVSVIKACAFYNLSAKSVTTNNVVTIYGDAFRGSSMETLNLSDSLEKVEGISFGFCPNLKTVNFGKGIKKIDGWTFEGSSKVTKVNVDSIEHWLNINFSTQISTPTYYSHSLYINNILLENLIVPEGFTEIKPNAFFNCTTIKKITLPETLSFIGKYAFYLTSAIIICKALVPPELYDANSLGTPSIIYVPDLSVNAYKTASGWSSHASKIRPLSEYIE
jgi:hypothetical protein